MISQNFLTNLFGVVNRDRNISCVLLNTCNCKKTTEAISKHVDCVIGQEGLISDEGAIGFASNFYLGLGVGRSINNAFEIACDVLQSVQETTEIISSPVLKYAPGVDPSKVILTRSYNKLAC